MAPSCRYGIVQSDSNMCLVMERMLTESLADRLKNRGTHMPWKQRLDFAHDIGCGMRWLHQLEPAKGEVIFFRVDIFLDSVRPTTRAPHVGPQHVRRANRNRNDPLTDYLTALFQAFASSGGTHPFANWTYHEDMLACVPHPAFEPPCVSKKDRYRNKKMGIVDGPWSVVLLAVATPYTRLPIMNRCEPSSPEALSQATRLVAELS